MKKRIFLLLTILLLGSLLSGCDYAGMRDDEAVNTYQMQLPDMPQGAVPLGGGDEPVFARPIEQVQNPLQPVPEVVKRGEVAYTYYCIQCHGADARGFGTVGQSFTPLPTDLTSPYVQNQPDGQLFVRIGKGYKRHPPLAYTVSIQDRWALIRYMRTLAGGPKT